MLALGGLVLLTPATFRLLPLLGAPRPVVERTLGVGRRVVDVGDPNRGVSVVAGLPSEVVAYRGVAVTYVGGRARTLARDFGKAPSLDWRAALARCGVPAQGVVATPDGGTLNLGGGAIPEFAFVTYTGAKATVPERTLVLSAPVSIVFPPTPADRKAILDRVRPLVEKTLKGQPVRFVVRSLAAAKGWAFLDARPVRPDGGRVDLRRSELADVAKAGMVGGTVAFLLRADAGGWRIVDSALFPTDVPWTLWAKAHHAPAFIFPTDAPE